MKCDIILDLLPLYIEDLCRPESKKAVTEHLAGCEDCQMEYQKLLDELLPSSSDDAVLDQYLEEKKLFIKSRWAVRDSLLAQGVRITEIIVLITALLCNIGMFLFVIKGYFLRYPALKMDESVAAYLWILFLPLLPTAVSLAGVITSHYKKRGRALRIISRIAFWLLIPSVLIGGLFTAVFLIMPPLCSRTDDPGRYMVLDEDMERSRAAISELFPEKIPDQAEAVSYRYQKYSALFSDTMTVECSFSLPDGTYREVRDKALSAPCFETSQTADKTAAALTTDETVTATVLPEGVVLEFSFDDGDQFVRYRARIDRNR